MSGQSSPHPLWFIFGALFLVGGVLSVCSIPGERAKRSVWLAEARAEAVVISPDRIDPANEGRWVLLTADTSGLQQTFTDPAYGITRTGFSLTRHGETFNDPGGESPVDWYATLPNAPPDLQAKRWRVERPRLGAFAVSDELLHALFQRVGGVNGADSQETNSKPPDWSKRLTKQQEVLWPPMTLPPFPDPPRPGWQLTRDNRHWCDCANPQSPNKGDHRVSYSCAAVPDSHITVLTKQTGDTLRGVPTGRGFELFTAIRPGALSLDDMIAEATREHERHLDGQRTASWVMAGIGAALVAAGVYFTTRRRKPSAAVVEQPTPQAANS